MTLEGLKKQGFFSNMSDSEILDLCSSLRINAKDMNFAVNESIINKLFYSSKLNEYKIREEISNQHQMVINKYQELIDRYKDMLKGISKYNTFTSETASITNLINNLEKEKKSYESDVKGFTINNTDQYFSYNSGSIMRGINSINSGIAKSNASLDKQLDDELLFLTGKIENIKRKNSKTLPNKIKDNIRIANLERKIERLRKKKGKIHSSQQRIITSSTSKYINNMDRKFEKYFKEQNRIYDAIENKKEDIREIKSLRQQAISEEQYISQLEVDKLNTGLIGRIGINIEQAKAKKEKEKMLKRLEQLRKKQGKVDISKQFSVAFSRNFSR